jgi:hypothetical protein
MSIRRCLVLVLVLASSVIASPAFAQAPTDSKPEAEKSVDKDDEKDKKDDKPEVPPQALLDWAIGKGWKKEDEEPKTKRSEPLQSDRPDFTEASTTVGRGMIQIEAGYTYSQDREGDVVRHGHSYAETLLRIGMFADWFEWRVYQNFTSESLSFRGRPADPHTPVRGAQDLSLGCKVALTEQNRFLPETAVILRMSVPTGSSEATAGKVLAGGSLLYGWDVIEDCLSLGGSTLADRAVDEDRKTHIVFAQSITVGYKLTRKLGAYTEWYALFPSGASAPGLSAQHYLDGGFTYKVTPDLQFDVRAGYGLSRGAQDFFVGAGFVARY